MMLPSGEWTGWAGMAQHLLIYPVMAEWWTQLSKEAEWWAKNSVKHRGEVKSHLPPLKFLMRDGLRDSSA